MDRTAPLIRCPICEWGPFAVTEGGRLVRHAAPHGEQCAGSGKTSPVRFRKVARAWIGNRHQGRGTAAWVAYVGDVEVGSWADGNGIAWGQVRPLCGYRQWRQIITDTSPSDGTRVVSIDTEDARDDFGT